MKNIDFCYILFLCSETFDRLTEFKDPKQVYDGFIMQLPDLWEDLNGKHQTLLGNPGCWGVASVSLNRMYPSHVWSLRCNQAEWQDLVKERVLAKIRDFQKEA